MTMPRSTRLAMIDGRHALVDERGEPVPDSMPVRTTAGELAASMAGYIEHAVAAGQRAQAATDQAAITAQAAELGEQVTATIAKTAQTYAQAGADAAVAHLAKTTTIRRRVERDEKDRIVGTIEERVPLPAPDQPASPKGPLGFVRRTAQRPATPSPAGESK